VRNIGPSSVAEKGVRDQENWKERGEPVSYPGDLDIVGYAEHVLKRSGFLRESTTVKKQGGGLNSKCLAQGVGLPEKSNPKRGASGQG